MLFPILPKYNFVYETLMFTWKRRPTNLDLSILVDVHIAAVQLAVANFQFIMDI